MSILDIFKKKMRGDMMLEIERSKSNLDISTILSKVRQQGATDNDIREWWNMPNEQWKEIMEDDDIAKVAIMKGLMDEGASYDEAKEKLKRTFPFFAIYEPEYLYGKDDDLLPYELKFRINKYMSNLSDEEKMEAKNASLSSYSSMNAYLREKIKDGLI